MTFLMHAASGSTERSADAGHSSAASRRRRGTPLQQMLTLTSADPLMPSYSRVRGVLPLDRFNGIAEEEDKDIEDGGPGPFGQRSPASPGEGDHATAPGDARGNISGRFGSSAPQIHPSVSQATRGDDTSEVTVDSSRRSKGLMDPSLVVFKTAWAMVEEVLWKNQVSF